MAAPLGNQYRRKAATARLNPRHQGMVRDKIQASQLINRLDSHCRGEISLSVSQVQAIVCLLEIRLGRKEAEARIRLRGGKPNERAGNAGVYLIEAIGSGRYKIGWSDNVDARMAQLSTGCPFPVKVMAVIESDMSGETWLHRRFKQFRVCGEWFELPQGAIDFICGLKPAEGQQIQEIAA